METFKTYTVAACLLNPDKQRTPRLRETYASSSLGQTAPKLVNNQCKSLDLIDHMSLFYLAIIILFISPFIFFTLTPLAFPI